ncbi:unnamed protein product [Ranitomeya imitator]|uniref:Calponin-homology (CH) domain-containing protein n=1 Tax=Ranitomeya imitator TaxID=111125 RepID=A0ABN9LHZ7_9NEOB|nr:unnamed protein product [Ranitomeya imitator]
MEKLNKMSFLWYTLNVLSDLGEGEKIDDRTIVQWVNETLRGAGKTTFISGFKDRSISTSLPVIDLIDVIAAKAVNPDMVKRENLSDADKMSNAK